MPYLTTRGSEADRVIAQAYARADQSAISVKTTLNFVRGRAVSGDLTALDIFVNSLQAVQNARSTMEAAAQVSGMADFAEAQFPGAEGYNVGASYVAFRDAMDDFITFLEANFGAASQWSGYSQAQRNAFIAQVDLVLAEVD